MLLLPESIALNMNPTQEILDQSVFEKNNGPLDLVNDTSVYYKGLFGLILCIILAGVIGLVLVKMSLDQGRVALDAYAEYPNKYTDESLRRVKAGRTMAYIGLAFFIVEIVALMSIF